MWRDTRHKRKQNLYKMSNIDYIQPKNRRYEKHEKDQNVAINGGTPFQLRDEPPILEPDCPPEEQFLFESRWKHRNKRGENMWECIQQEFSEKFQKNLTKEVLQMKIRRARPKFLHWAEQDVSYSTSVGAESDLRL